MNKIKFFSTLLILILSFSIAIPGISMLQFHANAQDDFGYEIVFTIPVGEDGIHYEGVGIPEMLTWGPAAFTVAPDGSYWIADTAGNRLLRYSSNGEHIGKINLIGHVVGATDLVANNDSILVLDQASIPPKVVRFTVEGDLLGSYELPDGLHAEDGLTGITRGDRGELLVEREFGAHVSQFLDKEGELIEKSDTSGYMHNGKIYTAYPSGLTSETPRHGTIFAGERKIEFDVPHSLGGMQILGFGEKNDFYVLLEELALNPAIQVDQTIRHYGAEGEFLGIARVPINQQYTYVAQALAIGQDDSIYALATFAEHVDILRLHFVQKLDPILDPLSDTGLPSVQKDEPGIETCVSRTTMNNTAYSYLSNSKYLSSTNTDGACTGRDKPSYLVGAGTYPSVSYDWNGFDTVSDFNSYMSPNTKQAGDTNKTNELCSKGVDCSGYASRIWQLATKKGTCTIEEISTPIPQDQLLMGDIINKCNLHTVIFRAFIGTSGIYAYESTTYQDYDRVWYGASAWSRFTGYTPRKFWNVCP